LTQSLGEIKKPWQWGVIGGGILLVWAAIAIPELHRTRPAIGPQTTHLRQVEEIYPASPMKAKASESMISAGADKAERATDQYDYKGGAAAARKIIRTSSLEMVVQRPAEAAEKIAALAESLGGYIEASNGGGQDATSGTLSVRVPADRFEQARAEIRKLGLRVETEKVDAKDVTRQYVDQDAGLRNLRAEESQYLTILKQATTVKEMMAVSEKLSEVRGQIEQQEAEFHALSRQIETVAIAISLRTEPEAQVLGLNWRPAYRLKLALRDGLESIADYTTTMTAILFYLPAVVLWVGTILIGLVGSWRLFRWIATRWFGWSFAAETAHE